VRLSRVVLAHWCASYLVARCVAEGLHCYYRKVAFGDFPRSCHPMYLDFGFGPPRLSSKCTTLLVIEAFQFLVAMLS
jgi:hypothetical protein